MLDHEQRQQLHTFDLDQFEIGQLLGQGGFSCVYNLRRRRQVRRKSSPSKFEFDLSSAETDLPTAPDVTNTSDCSSSTRSQPDLELASDGQDSSSSPLAPDFPSKEPLVAKLLHSKTLKEPKTAQKAARDLQIEATILSTIPHHRNIIQLRGVSAEFWTCGSLGSTHESFLVLEKLCEPLNVTLRRWATEARASFSSKSGLLNLFEKKHYLSRNAQADRLDQVALSVASAMKFLHKHNVIFRDLKPHNIGFDSEGRVRLFDFASARILDKSTDKLSRRCGTVRYMAKEVARKERYGLSADIYSYGMVVWELCTLTRPFNSASSKEQLNQWVQQPHKLPAVRQIASPQIRQLLTQCWSEDPQERPSFKAIYSQVKKEARFNKTR